MASGMDLATANAQACKSGYLALRRTIDEGGAYAFETTLGARSISFELMRALALDAQVDIFFVGLASVGLHLQRVAETVKRGGHDIEEADVRNRYDGSRENVLLLIGTQAMLRVWDNSPSSNEGTPSPVEVLKIQNRALKLGASMSFKTVPAWTKPLLGRAQEILPAAA